MMNWSAVATIEKNKLANDKPFLLLIKVDIPNVDEPVYIARNTEDVTWNGHVFTRYPVEVDDTTEDGKESSQINLKLSNAGGYLQIYAQKYTGFVDSTVTLYVVYAGDLDNPEPEFSVTLTCTASSYTEEWCTFTLSSDKDFSWRFPPYRYLQDYCKWRFKSVRCGYAGSESACDGTLATCRIPERFGGEPGIDSGVS